MTQYISDLLRKIQQQLGDIQNIIDQIIAPEDGDYVYVDRSRGGEDDHETEIPPYETNDSSTNDGN